MVEYRLDIYFSDSEYNGATECLRPTGRRQRSIWASLIAGISKLTHDNQIVQISLFDFRKAVTVSIMWRVRVCVSGLVINIQVRDFLILH